MFRLAALAALVLAPVSFAAGSPLGTWRPDTPVFPQVARLVAFLELTRGDELRLTNGVSAGVFVWGEKNKRYAVYAPSGGRVNLKIPAGDWRVRPYNPRTGAWGKKFDEKADESGLTLKFTADGDWAAVLVRD